MNATVHRPRLVPLFIIAMGIVGGCDDSAPTDTNVPVAESNKDQHAAEAKLYNRLIAEGVEESVAREAATKFRERTARHEIIEDNTRLSSDGKRLIQTTKTRTPEGVIKTHTTRTLDGDLVGSRVEGPDGSTTLLHGGAYPDRSSQTERTASPELRILFTADSVRLFNFPNDSVSWADMGKIAKSIDHSRTRFLKGDAAKALAGTDSIDSAGQYFLKPGARIVR